MTIRLSISDATQPCVADICSGKAEANETRFQVSGG